MKRSLATFALLASLLPVANSQGTPRESRPISAKPSPSALGEAIDGWVLVALVNVNPDVPLGKTAQQPIGVMPITTNLTFTTLSSCLAAESEMKRRWADHYNRAQKAAMGQESLDVILGQMVSGTCVPHRDR